MNAPRRVAVLHDSPDFGGHERAFLTWLPAILASPAIEQVHIMTPRANAALVAELDALAGAKLHVAPSGYVKASAEPLRAPFRFAFGRAAAAFVKDRGCDLVLLLQGRIENLATPMLWLPRRAEIVSYIPMAHSGSEMGKPAMTALAADALKRFYYRRPQRFIVPSRAVAVQARRAGTLAPIHVVENVPAEPLQNRERTRARDLLGLPADRQIALFMGRFDAYQKGLDHLLRDLKREHARLAAWYFVFVGRGAAAETIRSALGDGGVDGRVIDWTAEPDAYLAASDVLLAPSRFEGVPLIMLEALQQGLPILASDLDVYREYLPPEAIHDFNRPVDLPAALEASTSPEAIAAYRRHAQSVTSRLNLATSQAAFLAGLLGDRVVEVPA